PQELLTDAAGAYDTEGSAGKSHAHMIHALVPATASRQAILQHQFPGECQDERERNGRDRTRHGTRGVSHQHAGCRHRGNVDAVIADSMAGDDPKTAAVARDSGTRYASDIDIQRVVVR